MDFSYTVDCLMFYITLMDSILLKLKCLERSFLSRLCMFKGTNTSLVPSVSKEFFLHDKHTLSYYLTLWFPHYFQLYSQNQIIPCKKELSEMFFFFSTLVTFKNWVYTGVLRISCRILYHQACT